LNALRLAPGDVGAFGRGERSTEGDEVGAAVLVDQYLEVGGGELEATNVGRAADARDEHRPGNSVLGSNRGGDVKELVRTGGDPPLGCGQGTQRNEALGSLLDTLADQEVPLVGSQERLGREGASPRDSAQGFKAVGSLLA
jgi:hypothetical protein